MKTLIRITPRFIKAPAKKILYGVKALLLPYREYYADFRDYKKFSGTYNCDDSGNKVEAKIIRLYHAVEVGLTYENTKPSFAKEVVIELLKHLESAAVNSTFSRHCKIAINVLDQYVSKNREIGADESWIQYVELALSRINQSVSEEMSDEKRGGILKLKRDDIFNDSKGFEGVLNGRHSFREFSAEPVSMEIINKAVELAQRAPSACNRQQARVYVLNDREIRSQVLDIQNNRSNWREVPDKMLLVTSNLEYYAGLRERHSPYIDGSLFAMTLVWALQYFKVGTCCLNLNMDRYDLARLRAVAKMEPSEVPIFLIAAGALKEETSVAASTRRHSDEIIRVI
jgi:nitroreductase